MGSCCLDIARSDPRGCDLPDLGRDIDPIRPTLLCRLSRFHCFNVSVHAGLDVVQRHFADIEERMQVGWQLVQLSERTCDHHISRIPLQKRFQSAVQCSGSVIVCRDEVPDLLALTAVFGHARGCI